MKNPAPSLLFYGLIPLLLLSLCLYLIQAPNFLFWWDERFHALVAKNLLAEGSITRLYPPELENWINNPKVWYQDPIWLHKPPFFSYLQAGSMYCFGANIPAFRLPSALFLLGLYFSFTHLLKSGGLSLGISAGISLLSVLNPFLLKLMMGWQGMDHNDLAFIALISFSFNALISYQKKAHWERLVLISVCVALALLTKWLPGLLVYLFWGLQYLLNPKDYRLQPILSSLALSLILALPWQLYTYQLYPEKWLEAMLFNTRHFSEVIEGHKQIWYYPLLKWLENFFLLIALVFISHILKGKEKAKSWNRAALISIGFVMVFYSIAQTKLPAFSFIALPLVLLLLAKPLKNGHLQGILTLSFLLLSIVHMAWLPMVNFAERFPHDTARAEFFQSLDERIPQKSVLISPRELGHIDAMFYCNHLVLDQSIPLETIKTLAKQYPLYQLEQDSSGLEIAYHRLYITDHQ